MAHVAEPIAERAAFSGRRPSENSPVRPSTTGRSCSRARPRRVSERVRAAARRPSRRRINSNIAACNFAISRRADMRRTLASRSSAPPTRDTARLDVCPAATTRSREVAHRRDAGVLPRSATQDRRRAPVGKGRARAPDDHALRRTLRRTSAWLPRDPMRDAGLRQNRVSPQRQRGMPRGVRRIDRRSPRTKLPTHKP